MSFKYTGFVWLYHVSVMFYRLTDIQRVLNSGDVLASSWCHSVLNIGSWTFSVPLLYCYYYYFLHIIPIAFSLVRQLPTFWRYLFPYHIPSAFEPLSRFSPLLIWSYVGSQELKSWNASLLQIYVVMKTCQCYRIYFASLQSNAYCTEKKYPCGKISWSYVLFIVVS